MALPRTPLHHQPLDPLPPGVEQRRPERAARRLAPEGTLLLLLFALFGNPWMARLVFSLQPGRSGSDDSALATFIRFIVEVSLRTLVWPVLVPDLNEGRDLSFWFGYQLRTAAFLAIALPLLNRLAGTTFTRNGRPDALARGLAVLGAVLVSAVVGGVLSGLYFGARDQRDYYPESIVTVEFSSALYFGLLFGAGLGVYAARRRSRRDERRRMTPLGGA